MERIKTILEYADSSVGQEIGEAEFKFNIDHAQRMKSPVHRWSGEDRDGRPITVWWVTGPRTGRLFGAYEIS